MDNIERTSKIAGIAGEIAKIAAIIVGGIWVITNFIWVEGPTRAAALASSLKLNVSPWSDGLCSVDIDTRVSNGSQQTIAVSTTSLRLWVYTPRPDVSKVALLDWDAVHALDPVWELPLDKSRFNRTYEPGQSANYTYTVFIPAGSGQFVHTKLAVTSPDQSIESEFFAESTTRFAAACG